MDENNKNIYFSDKYKMISNIGSGSFGEVYLVQDVETKKYYAAKLEQKNHDSRLKSEYDIYLKLKHNGVTFGIPKVICFIETSQYNILIMELLGKNLDMLFEEYGKKFDIKTVLKIGIDILSLIKSVHNAGFIHRDIKPNNFMIGGGSKKDKLYILDFGLSKQYVKKQKHINIHMERSLVGTARYASINVHMGIEPSRRDDLESIGYMLIYFIKGRLPWQELKKKRGTDKIKAIGDRKTYTDLDKLCNGIPKCFPELVKYSRNLQFDQCPDYDYLISLFVDSAKQIKNGNKLEYCWTKNT